VSLVVKLAGEDCPARWAGGVGRWVGWAGGVQSFGGDASGGGLGGVPLGVAEFGDGFGERGQPG
jgi:hypothetical protein